MSKKKYFPLHLILFSITAFLGTANGLAAEDEKIFDMINEARTVARTGNYAEALDKLQEAIALASEKEDRLALAIAYNNAAEIHRLQGNNIEALESYSQALQVYHDLGHRSGIAATGQKIDKILGRPERPKTIAAPQPTQEPETVPAPEPVETPQIAIVPQPALPTTPSPEIQAEPRSQLIEEAINRVRNRVKDRREAQAPKENVAARAPEPMAIPPQEPQQQSAKLDTPPVTRRTDYSAYLEMVKENIVRAWQYPEQASEQGEEGKVDVEFTILKDGRLLDVRILQSSGYSALDREALRAVGAASPFTPIPEQIALEQLSIRFTFNYTLEKRPGSR